MRNRNSLLTAVALLALALFATPALQAQTCDGTGINFVDLDGDGYNDNAADLDGDGIPNGLDDDFIKNAQDGSGYQNGRNIDGGFSVMGQGLNRLRLLLGDMFQNKFGLFGEANGPGDCDGDGTGDCDGAGPHGNR